MYETWGNPANWTMIQWLSVFIMAFVIIAILVTIQKLLSIIKMSRKQQYKPNLRRLRNVSVRPSEATAETSEKAEDGQN